MPSSDAPYGSAGVCENVAFMLCAQFVACRRRLTPPTHLFKRCRTHNQRRTLPPRRCRLRARPPPRRAGHSPNWASFPRPCRRVPTVMVACGNLILLMNPGLFGPRFPLGGRRLLPCHMWCIAPFRPAWAPTPSCPPPWGRPMGHRVHFSSRLPRHMSTGPPQALTARMVRIIPCLARATPASGLCMTRSPSRRPPLTEESPMRCTRDRAAPCRMTPAAGAAACHTRPLWWHPTPRCPAPPVPPTTATGVASQRRATTAPCCTKSRTTARRRRRKARP